MPKFHTPSTIETPMRWSSIDPTRPMFNDMSVSLGLAPVLNTFYTWSTLRPRQRPTWDIYLVNVLTLVRNCMDPKKGLREILNQVVIDIEILTKYISSYTSLDRMDPHEPKLIFYLPTYNIQPEYLRPPNKQTQDLTFVYEKLVPHLKVKEKIFESLMVYTVQVGKKRLPHLDLELLLPAIDKRFRYKRICMLSSIPLDYHFYRFVPDFKVLRSFTADLMTKDQFGEKVFKHPVPFNAYTHILFGDNKMIKSPLGIKQKRELIETATKNKWKFQPEQVIFNQIQAMNLVPKMYLNNIKI